jgi:hypothetical protein
MKNILLNGNNCDFDGVLASTLSILKRSENDETYTFYIYGETTINDQMLDYFNDIVIGFNYKNKVVKINANNICDDEYIITQNQKCEIEDILTECKILKEIYLGGIYYA